MRCRKKINVNKVMHDIELEWDSTNGGSVEGECVNGWSGGMMGIKGTVFDGVDGRGGYNIIGEPVPKLYSLY